MNKKEFKDYNDYHDRGIMKWQTAFALGELTTQIKEGYRESTLNVDRLQQQSLTEIESYLEQSIKYNKMLEIQLNELDELGRVKEHIFGNFRGMIELDVAQIGNQYIELSDIRHIKIHDFRKWSDVSDDAFEDAEMEEVCDDEFREYFEDRFWIE